MKHLEDSNKLKKPWKFEGVEWREVKFLKKVDLIKGIKPKNILKEKQENSLPYLTTEYFRSGLIKEYVPLNKNKITLVEEGDLVIIADGSRSGELFFCDMKGVLVSTMAKFEFNESNINKKYLFWFLTTHFEHLNKSKYTATPHVNKNYLKTLKIPLPFRNGKPDLETQKKIVEYIEANFSKIDKILEKKKKEFEKLNELWESVLEQAFKPKEGEEWKVVRFTDVVEVLDRYRIPVKKKDRKPGPYPYCGANGVIDFIDGYTHNGKFLLLAEDGGFFGKGEQTAYIMNGKFWANNHVHVLKVKSSIYLKFLYHFSIFYDFTPYLRGATRPKLSQTGMRRIKIPLPFRNNQPDLEKQREIANYLDSVYEKIKTLKQKIQNQITQLEEMKESILDEVFNHDESYCS